MRREPEMEDFCGEHNKICDSKEEHTRRIQAVEYKSESLEKDIAAIKKSLEPLEGIKSDLLVFKTEIKTTIWVGGILISAGCTVISLSIGLAGVAISYMRLAASGV